MAFSRRKPADIGYKSPFSDFVEPALASSIDKVPSGSRWIHEIKFDGYRVQVHLHNEAVKVFTRRGHDWTNRFKKVAVDAWHIKAASAIIDGEIVVPAADGTTDFSVLQNELKGSSKKIVMVAFDLIYLNGRDLRKLPLFKRKAELKKIAAGTDIQFSESFEIDGLMFAHACKVGLEGVVSKVRDGVYPRGRSNDWVKKTCAQRETLTIAGFALDGTKWDGLYVGRRKGPDLVYAGKVDHGFDKASTAELRRRLEPLVRKTQLYSKRIAHKGFWVEPKLSAEIEYRAKSAEGKVRHPFFKVCATTCRRPPGSLEPKRQFRMTCRSRRPDVELCNSARRGRPAAAGDRVRSAPGRWFEVVECATAEAAELIVASTGTELQALVADHNLAGNMTGSDLADYARGRHPWLNIVVMSGSVVDGLPPRTIFLKKPFAPRELLNAVRN